MAVADQYGIVSIKPPLAPTLTPGNAGIVSDGRIAIKSGSNVAVGSPAPSTGGTVSRGGVVNGN